MAEKKFTKALITGANSGIGEALAQLLAEKNISLILHGRDQLRLNQIADKIGTQVQTDLISGDLSIKEERERVIQAIQKYNPDLIINNAGFGLYGDALTHSVPSQMKILEVNGNAVLEITLEAAKNLSKNNQKGTILNVSSAAAFHVFPYLAVYAATKAFVLHLSEALDSEWKDKGIRVLTACPGVVKTQFRLSAGGGKQEDGSMSPIFAAKEIWWQIENEKIVHTFNWKYRLGNWISKIVPQKWKSELLKGSVNEIINQKDEQ